MAWDTNSSAVTSGELFSKYLRSLSEGGKAEGSMSFETTGINGFPMPMAAPISKKRLGRFIVSGVTSNAITLLSRNPFSNASVRECPK